MEDYVIFGFDKDIRVCPFCEKAKELLDNEGRKYKFYNVAFNTLMTNMDDVKMNREKLMQMAGLNDLKSTTFPQIFEYVDYGDLYEEVHIGGYMDLKEIYDNSKTNEDFANLL